MVVPVEVCFRPQDAAPPPEAAVVVVDVLRATSTIAVALAAGAAAVRPVPTAEAGLALRAADPDRLLVGEREAHPAPGFDLGNSPAAMLTLAMVGREVLLAVGDAAAAFAAVAGAADVYSLSLLNLEAVAAVLADSPPPGGLWVVCAGNGGAPGLDDAYVAGALADRLQGRAPERFAPSERAAAVLWLYRGAPPRPYAALAETAAGRALLRQGYRADVEFCARRDAFAVVPRLRSGLLVVG